MATLTIKNIPALVHKRLKKLANMHRRSLNNEVIACLEQAVQSTPFDAESFLTSLRNLRDTLKQTLTPKDFSNYKNQGRP